MPRFFAPITIDELKRKIEDAHQKHSDWDGLDVEDDKSLSCRSDRYCFATLTPQIIKDIKVRFDLENVFSDKSYQWDRKTGKYSDKLDDNPMNQLLGYNTLDNIVVVIGRFLFFGLFTGMERSYEPMFQPKGILTTLIRCGLMAMLMMN
jgi:hypothetical protein